jgi:putative transposase
VTPRRAVELHAGARILTNHGLLLVMHLERHGARVQDALGVMSSIFYDAVIAAQVGDGAVQAVHSSLEPWWSGLTVDTRANALFRQEVVLEVLTGYRDGHPELAYDGEPFFPFGTGYGTSIRQRCDAMAEQVSFERSVDRAVMRRVREAELVTGRMARQSIQRWVTAWRHEGLRGLVDGRKTKGKQGFEILDPRFLRIADEEFAAFDGGISAVNQEEIERRIRVRLKQEGITDAHLPQRLTQEYLSNRHTALGRTTRAHRSNAQRAVSSRSSYSVTHPSHLAIDVTRADNLVWDEVQERVYSVEIISLISVSTRVILACRVVPRSANGVEVGLALYDAMRPFSMLVEDTTIEDFRWSGIPASLDFSGNPFHTGRQQVVKAQRALKGVHHLPGVIPSSLRADNGSIFLGRHFRALLNEWQIDLMLSRGSKPTDNPQIERWHETLQRAYQQIPGFKGRGVYERGRWVAQAEQPLLTATELQRHLHRFIALDYHRSKHRGLKLADRTQAHLSPLEMFDALMDATGRILVPQHPDLIYQFLPIRWLTPGHSGIDYRGLSYDAEILDGLRNVREGTFRAEDGKVPFHYDPRDVTRIWHRSRDDGRIHEIPWRSRHLVHAPLTDVVRDRAIALIKKRGGNNVLSARNVQHQIIEEITELTAARNTEDWKAQMSAARLRFEQSRIDHDEAADAGRLIEDQHAHAQSLPRIPRKPPPGTAPAAEGIDFDTPWPDFDEEAL